MVHHIDKESMIPQYYRHVIGFTKSFLGIKRAMMCIQWVLFAMVRNFDCLIIVEAYSEGGLPNQRSRLLIPLDSCHSEGLIELEVIFFLIEFYFIQVAAHHH